MACNLCRSFFFLLSSIPFSPSFIDIVFPNWFGVILKRKSTKQSKIKSRFLLFGIVSDKKKYSLTKTSLTKEKTLRFNLIPTSKEMFYNNLLFFYLFCIVFANVANGNGNCRKRLTIEERCDNPPTVLEVDLAAYTGLWYQIFITPGALRYSDLLCVNAFYRLTSTNPLSIDVVNCKTPSGSQTQECSGATASERPGGDLKSQLQVKFAKSNFTGAYNIIGLLGFPNHGYFAAAVYFCERRGDDVSDGFYILSRTPYAPVSTLRRMIKQLRCNGYKGITYRGFQKSLNPSSCQYNGRQAG